MDHENKVYKSGLLNSDKLLFKHAILDYNPVNMQEEGDKNIMLDYIEIFAENILTRENKIAHMTSSALILNEKMDKILMIHHNIYKTWSWTGGHADHEEETSGVKWIERSKLEEYSDEPYLIEIYNKILIKAVI